MWTWLLHGDRHSDIRVQVSQWIHSRWKIRARNLANRQRNGRIPMVTERKKKRTVEPGTAGPVRKSKKLRTVIQKEKTPTRRCPPRACKEKRNQTFHGKRTMIWNKGHRKYEIRYKKRQNLFSSNSSKATIVYSVKIVIMRGLRFSDYIC